MKRLPAILLACALSCPAPQPAIDDARLHALGIEAMRLGDEIAVTWQPGPRLAELTRRFDAVMADRAAIRAGLDP